MEWRGTFCCLFFLFELVKSTSQSGKVWALYLGAESVVNVSWPIFSAGIFVLLALILSMYLIFEHLAAYNQPEVCSHIFSQVVVVAVVIINFVLSSCS
jgi:hypothetical protein